MVEKAAKKFFPHERKRGRWESYKVKAHLLPVSSGIVYF